MVVWQTQLRWHGSKLVLKYPRCSLKRFSAYADAEVSFSNSKYEFAGSRTMLGLRIVVEDSRFMELAKILQGRPVSWTIEILYLSTDTDTGVGVLISFGCIQVDPSQMQALAAIWSVLLTAGVALAVGLPACTLSNACEAVLNAQVESHHVRVLSDSNRVLAMVTGFLIGAPVAKAAGTYLQTSGRVWFMHSNMFSIVAHLVYFEL